MAKKPMSGKVELKKEVKRIKVKAVRLGYYEHKRRKPGAVFFMNESDFEKHDRKGLPVKDKHSGEQVYCSWVELAPSHAKAEAPKKKTLQELSVEREEQELAAEAELESEDQSEEAEGDNVI